MGKRRRWPGHGKTQDLETLRAKKMFENSLLTNACFGDVEQRLRKSMPVCVARCSSEGRCFGVGILLNQIENRNLAQIAYKVFLVSLPPPPRQGGITWTGRMCP